MNASPIIGFSLDYETGGGYSKLPHFAIRENYTASISALGAVPVALPQETGLVERYLELIDGLVVTGGAFDIPPSLYGDEPTHETVVLKEDRTAFEFAITQERFGRHMPVLGICGGEQLLAVVLGGTLVQHIPDRYPDSAIAREQPNPRHEPGHEVAIAEGTLLHRIAGQETIAVNSAHHQSVASVPEGVTVNAVAPDGVIEGLEYSAHPFCLGVQWHPEYHVSPVDERIFKAFVEACRAYVRA